MLKFFQRILSFFKTQPKIAKVKLKKQKKKSYYQKIKESNPEKYEAYKKRSRDYKKLHPKDKKKKYGVHGFVILKDSGYDKLLKDYESKEELDTAINKLDAEIRLAKLNGYKTSKTSHEKLLRKGSMIWKDTMKTVKMQEKVIQLQSIPSTESQKKAYGQFKNVMLTDSEGALLRETYGTDLEMAISILDCYIENSGAKSKRYRNHFAVLHKYGWVWNKVQDNKKKMG